MAVIFDGKEYAAKKKLLLQSSVNKIRQLGVIPHMSTILIGKDSASVLYVNLKKKFMEEIGCQLDIYKLSSKVGFEEVKLLINTLNEDQTVHGVMVQFPLPEKLSDKKEEIINLIGNDKDVDGLQENSKYLHPTSKAVLEILAMAIHKTKINVKSVCVIGAEGMVGKPLVKQLSIKRYKLQGETLQSDAVISATGKMNLITSEMIKKDTIVIDVGSPHGDVMQEVSNKASFFTPVPGGVGPVTITCLAENLIIASSKN